MYAETQHDPLAQADLRQRLAHVYWIGGASGAGKTTIANRIAAEHGLHLYSTDDAMPGHAKRAIPEQAPYLQQFIAMDMDERWVNRTPQEMLETFHWFRGEGFGLIVEDLLQLPEEPVVVEGFRLLPDLVQPLLADPSHAVWLLPTPDFRRAVFAGRGLDWGFLPKTSKPEAALHNVLQRDAMFTSQLQEQITQRSLTAITVSTSDSEDELAKQVAQAFGL